MEHINSIDDIIELATSGFTDWRTYGHVTVRRYDDLLIFNYNTMAQYNMPKNGLILSVSVSDSLLIIKQARLLHAPSINSSIGKKVLARQMRQS
ncbi:MAG: hypothetical protein AAF846_02400 [Chloroflexota bacterium]